MPNINQLIKSEAIKRKVLQYIVEKDYALSYLLASIAKTTEFGETLVLKGGTALKKLYYDQYRFSEDLDFSTRIIGPISNIDSSFKSQWRICSQL
jgi:predicted nucleotidyltransferase component of viral defense system